MLFALNLLQENIGDADVLPRDAEHGELSATLSLNWEIFPPGTVDEVVEPGDPRRWTRHREQEALMRERDRPVPWLKPKRYIQGRGGMNRYIGALFANDLVVFENVRYGNAPYVLYGKWEEISKRSRIDLLANRTCRLSVSSTAPIGKNALRLTSGLKSVRRKINDDDDSLFAGVA